MGMPCEVNCVLKLSCSWDYIQSFEFNKSYQETKEGYRIYPLDTPLFVLDREWDIVGVVVINELNWGSGVTNVFFNIISFSTERIPYPRTNKLLVL